jgi:TRAP transporter TAXI family solute receptor
LSRFSGLILLFVATVTPLAAQTGDLPKTGVSVKRPVFGGACRLCPWGALGEIVKQAMKPYGYDVQLCYNCNRADAPRIVAGAKLPPPYEKDPAVSVAMAPPNALGLGPVDFGATAVQFLWSAYRGTGVYAKDKPMKNLRLIANIQSPYYLIVAAKADTGITDLAQIRKKRWPVRVLIGLNADAGETILEYYGLSRQSIEAAGGHVSSSRADWNDFDVIIGGGSGLATAPEWNVWLYVSQKFKLNYPQLPEPLLAKLAKEGETHRGTIPVGLLPGIERPIPTVVRTGTVIYCRSDAPDDFAYAVARAMDEHQDLLQWSHLNFSYNVHNVWKAYDVPLHPGAARYYKSVGYMK